MANEDSELPPEIAAEAARIRAEGETGAEPAPVEEVQVEAVEERPKSRRQQAEEERAAQLKAIDERAAKAAEIAEKTRQELAESMGQMRSMLEQQRQPQYFIPPQQQQPEKEKDWRDKHAKAMKKAETALAEGKLGDYHDHLRRALRIEMEAEFKPKIEDVSQRAQAFQQQQPMQLPSWIPAVESSFSDVLKNPQGRDMAITFARIEMSKTPGAMFNAQILEKGFERARQELGLSRQAPETTERAKQLLSGGAVNGGSGRAPASANGKPKVSVPKDYKEIARRVGMTPEEYVRQAAAMQSNK